MKTTEHWEVFTNSCVENDISTRKEAISLALKLRKKGWKNISIIRVVEAKGISKVIETVNFG